MRVAPDCFPCLLRQAINTARSSGVQEAQLLALLREVIVYAAQADLSLTPARFAEPAYAMVARLTGVTDPYAAMKQETNALALRLLPKLRDRITQTRDPLTLALQAAAAGNVIDAGVDHHADLRERLNQLLQLSFTINDLPVFRKLLKRGSRLLYLADNAGEIVLDVLAVERIQRLGVHVTVAVKSGPIINDATMEDARVAGLPRICDVIETGAASIGLDMQRVTPDFRAAYQAADAVIGKGHGHLETLFRDPHPGLFFLLKVKCPVVAKALHCKIGDLVFRHASRLHSD